MQRIENRKLPAWLGSILFHAVLLLLVLLWFSSPAPKSAPGERNAIGSIALQPSGAGRQTDSSTDSQTDEPEQMAADLEALSSANLNALPAIPALAPGQNQNVSNPGSASAADITGALESVSGGARVGVGEAVVRVFGTEGKGTKFVYVFDRSLSMEGKRIQMAKAELIRSLDSLGDHHQFNIIFYSSGHQLWRQGRRLIYASEIEKRGAVQYINGMAAEGGTRHYPPLSEAIALRPDVIFFLTDGEREDDRTLQLDALERENSRYGRGAQINVIQFGGGGFTDSKSRVLEQLATQNNGQYLYYNVSGTP